MNEAPQVLITLGSLAVGLRGFIRPHLRALSHDEGKMVKNFWRVLRPTNHLATTAIASTNQRPADHGLPFLLGHPISRFCPGMLIANSLPSGKLIKNFKEMRI